MSLKSQQLKEERVLLLESWKTMEEEFGSSEQVKKVEEKMPRVVKKRRRIEEDGSWEEYYDYIFPDDEVDKPNFKLLEMAHQWKLKMQQD
jgi:crooked neck